MSLAITMEKVIAILLADGWHSVQKGSFILDAYEFRDEGGCHLVKGGSVEGICSTGAEWLELGRDFQAKLIVSRRCLLSVN